MNDEPRADFHHMLAMAGLVVLVGLFGAFYSGGTTSAQSSPRLVIAPDSLTVDIGDTVRLNAFYDPNGCYGEFGCEGLVDVTQEASWSHGLTSAEVNRLNPTQPGVYVAQDYGNVNVIARYASLSDNTIVSVNIPPSAFVYLHIQGVPQSVEVGETFSVTAEYDPNSCSGVSGCFGQSDVTTSALWSSQNISVIRSLGGGRFEAVGQGAARVQAMYGGNTSSEEVFVSAVGGGTGGTGGGGDTGTYDVSYEKDLVTGLWSPHGSTDGITSVHWTGKYFVTLGRCANSGGGGMYVFTEDGTMVGKGHLCADSGYPGSAEHSFFAFAGPPRIIDESTWAIVPGCTGFCTGRGVMVYRVSNGRLNFLGRTFGEDSTHSHRVVAKGTVVGNRIVAEERRTSAAPVGDPQYGDPRPSGNYIYSLPIPQEVGRGISVVPNVSIGNLGLVVRSDYDSSGNFIGRKWDVYKFENDEFTPVGELPTPANYATKVLPFISENRIVEVSSNGINVLEPVGDEFVIRSQFPVSNAHIGFSGYVRSGSDEYFTFRGGPTGGCTVTQISPNNFEFGGSPGFSVLKNNTSLSVQKIPSTSGATKRPRPDFHPDCSVSYTAVSPSGKVVAVSDNWAVMYQINDASTGGGDSTDGDGGTTGGDTGGGIPGFSRDIQFYLDLANRYIKQLQNLQNLPSTQNRLQLIDDISSDIQTPRSSLEDILSE